MSTPWLPNNILYFVSQVMGLNTVDKIKPSYVNLLATPTSQHYYERYFSGEWVHLKDEKWKVFCMCDLKTGDSISPSYISKYVELLCFKQWIWKQESTTSHPHVSQKYVGLLYFKQWAWKQETKSPPHTQTLWQSKLPQNVMRKNSFSAGRTNCVSSVSIRLRIWVIAKKQRKKDIYIYI